MFVCNSREDSQLPKCLLRFDGMTLLERHLRMLKHAGVTEVVLALGFRHELVEAELDRLGWMPRPQIVLNTHFELGSVLTVHTVADALTRGGDVLLMDADVLYYERILRALVAGGSAVNRLLIDRDFEAGDEPVKLCVQGGVPVELRKQLAADLQFDTIGESVGFFRFERRCGAAAGGAGRGLRRWRDAPTCRTRKPCATCSKKKAMVRSGRCHGISMDRNRFSRTDVVRATEEVLPQLEIYREVAHECFHTPVRRERADQAPKTAQLNAQRKTAPDAAERGAGISHGGA